MPRRQGQAGQQIKSRSAFKRELIDAPSTSWRSYVFPWDKIEQSFCVASFDSTISDGRITQAQIDNMIKALRRSPYYQPKRPYWLTFATFLSLLIVAILFVICEQSANKSKSTAWRVIFSVYLAIGAAIIGGLVYGSHKHNSRRANELRKVVQEQQEREFTTKGAILTLSDQGAYLEIKFMWKEQATGAPAVDQRDSPISNSSSQPPEGHYEKDHNLNPEQVNLKFEDERTPQRMPQGDNSPPQIRGSPKLSPRKQPEVPIRNIVIQYSPESRGVDVRQNAIYREYRY